MTKFEVWKRKKLKRENEAKRQAVGLNRIMNVLKQDLLKVGAYETL